MKDIRKVIGLLLCMTICCYMTGKEKKNLNIVFIGNSITQGALLENPRHEAPPVKAALYLRRQPSVGTVRYSNQGVSGSTTFDFLPQTDLLFPKVAFVLTIHIQIRPVHSPGVECSGIPWERGIHGP